MQCECGHEQTAGRFCGRCGKPLQPDTAAPAAAGTQDRHAPGWKTVAAFRQGRTSQRSVRALVAVVVVVIAGAIGVSQLLTDDGSVPPSDSDESADAMPDSSNDLPDAQMSCIPADCVLWELDLGEGHVAERDGLLIHLGLPQSQTAESSTQDFRLTAVSTSDGSVLWEQNLGVQAGPAGLEEVAVRLVDDELLLVSAGDGLVAFDTSGEQLWQVPVSASGRMQVARAGTNGDVLVWAGPPLEMLVPDGDLGTLMSVDRSDGTVRWSIAQATLAAFTEDHALVVRGAEELTGIDLTSGTEAEWSFAIEQVAAPDAMQDGLDPTRTRIPADKLLAILGEDGFDVFDTTSGQIVAAQELHLTDQDRVATIGQLLLVEHGHSGLANDQPGPISFHPLDDAAQEPIGFDDATAVIELGTDPLISQQSEPAPEPGGVAVATQTDNHVDVTVLDDDGTTRWHRAFELPDPACCWRLHPGLDTSSLVVLPPADVEGPIRVLSSQDGSTTRSFELPSELASAENIQWIGDIAHIGARPDSALETTLVLPSSQIRLQPTGRIVALAPVPVLQVGQGTYSGLDPQVLEPSESAS